jgi:archaellum component FlaC
MQEACQKKKHEALDLNKQIIDLKEIVEKSKKDVKEGKITTKNS